MAPADHSWGKNDRNGRRDDQLDWSDSNLTDEGLERKTSSVLPKVFDRMWTDDGTAECTLSISGNQLQGPSALASTLSKFRKNHVRVTVLRLHKNQLGDEAMQTLAEHIEHAADDGQPLMELHLSDNRISEVGLRALIKAANSVAQRTGAYKGKRGKGSDGKEDRRHAALWLRAENQKPAIADSQGLLDRLAAEGIQVCLLPSKDWPPAGKGKLPKPDAVVHMHHSFVRPDRRANGEWEDREEKGKSGHGKGGDEEWRTSEKGKPKGKSSSWDDWHGGQGSAKGWKSYSSGHGKGKGWSDSKGDSKGDRGESAESWRDEGSSKGWRNMWWTERRSQDSWKGWGRWNAWDDADREGGDGRGRQRHPAVPPGHFHQWPQDEQDADYGGVMHPGFIGDITGSRWLACAAQGVHKKIRDCQVLDMLKRSLNPAQVPDQEWQCIAEMGAQHLAQACMQRSSVVVGSFATMVPLQELNCTCVGQVGLAAIFRHLELGSLLAPDSIGNDRDDVRCASIIAAVYGELLDSPTDGESAARENARTAAQWAVLDFAFLLGATRLSFGSSSVSAGENMPGD